LRRKRRRTQTHTHHERWLVSYADFITLLFAFFVVLYASSQVDHRKVGKLAVAIQVAFQELGVFSPNTVQIPLDSSEALPLATMQAIEEVKRKAQLGLGTAPKDAPAGQSDSDPADESDLATLQEELQDALRNEIALHEISLHRETEGLVVSLKEFGFFDSGTVALKPESLPALDRIASILAIRICRLRIEGHTDNVPIHTAQLESNWELSTARATELVRILIIRHRFGPERLSAAGYAQYHPIASNSTAQGRAQNRRVDIVILGAQPMTAPVSLAPPKAGDSAAETPSPAPK
jgi:chemotaxis protein MotB